MPGDHPKNTAVHRTVPLAAQRFGAPRHGPPLLLAAEDGAELVELPDHVLVHAVRDVLPPLRPGVEGPYLPM